MPSVGRRGAHGDRDFGRGVGVKVSLVVVCHYSSKILPICVDSFRASAAAASLESEIVVVEQSEDETEVAAVKGCSPDRMLVRPNGGYAAGLNAGAAEASGEVIFLANPDIELLDGSVGALTEAALESADVVGPQLLWDAAGDVMLPAPDDPGPLAEVGRTIRRNWPRRRDLEGRIEANWNVWTAEEPCSVPALRGPLLVAKRAAVDRLGRFDEGYFLYYEETEWLWRARRRGARLSLVPQARVVHRWGHATARRNDLDEIEARSRARFFRRNYSGAVRALLRVMSSGGAPADGHFVSVEGPAALQIDDADVWLLSIVPQMEPAVGCVSVAALPRAALELAGSGRWYAVAARREERRWRVRGAWTWETR